MASGSSPDAVVFELTESVLAPDVDSAAVRLNEIRDPGPRLAIDDVGTGYSSLSYLRSLPVDLLKMAQPVIEDMAGGDTTFVAAVIGLGQQLGFTVVAEGIEQESAVTVLRDLGCDLAEGYHFAQPMVPVKLVELISQRASAELLISG